MKKLTFSSMAAARLRANKKSYVSLLLGIFLSIFMISTLIFSIYGIYQAELEKRYDKVGYLDIVMLDNDVVTEEDVQSFAEFDRIGHAYISGIVTDRNVYVGYYDETGLSLMNLEPLEGRFPESAGEIALEASAMDILELDCQIGETVELSITPVDGTEETRSYTVVGILPERSVYLSYSDRNGLSQFPAIVTSSQETEFAVGRLGVHCLMELGKYTTLDMAVSSFWEKSRGYGIFGYYYGLTTTGEQIMYSSSYNTIYGNQEMFTLISMACVLAAALILSCGIGISGAMEGVLSKRREEIGVLRALGATKRQIRGMFGRENLILALIISPVSILVSIGAVWVLSALMPENIKLAVNLWLILPIAVFSVIVILISGYLPLVRASRLMPMSVIRDTAMLRRSKGVKSKKEFSATRLISARQVRFNPTRQIGSALLVGLMLLCSGLLSAVIYGYQSYYDSDSAGFSVNSSSGLESHYIQSYESEPMSSQSIRQLQSLSNVDYVRIDREMAILAQLETVPRYALLGVHDQFGMLNDALFEEAMTMHESNREFYEEDRASDREEYLQMLEVYQFENEVFQLSIMTVDLTKENVNILKDHLTDGNIDVDAINAGSQVLILAPNIWIMPSENGGYTYWDTEESVKNDPSAEGAQLMAWNNCFSAGQILPLTQLYTTDGGDTIQREDADVQICGVVDGLGTLSYRAWSDCVVITTEQGLESMGFRVEGLREVEIYLDGELTLEEEEILERQITAIARRYEGYSVQNYMELSRQREQARRQELILYISVVTIFFAVAVGMIVSAVTRQVNSEGRTIGMLRAVGADEKAIQGCYSGQLNAAVLGGLGITTAIGLVFLGMCALNAMTYNYNIWTASFIKEILVVAVTSLAMAAVCWLICRCILRFRIREVVNKSIIDNIREL